MFLCFLEAAGLRDDHKEQYKNVVSWSHFDEVFLYAGLLKEVTQKMCSEVHLYNRIPE